jgi:hypothetical protein
MLDNKTIEKIAGKAAHAIMLDLSDRRGYGMIMDDNEDLNDEIILTWEKIISDTISNEVKK